MAKCTNWLHPKAFPLSGRGNVVPANTTPGQTLPVLSQPRADTNTCERLGLI